MATRLIALALTGLGACLVLGSAARAAASPCTASLTERIPLRPAHTPTGSQFGQLIARVDGTERERMISDALLAGDMPTFLRRFAPVHLAIRLVDGQLARIVLCVAPDYLAVGSDSDFLLMPMRLATALQLATRFGLALPTPRIVDAIYAQAAVRLPPQPLPASDSMRTTAYYLRHNALVTTQRAALGIAPGLLSAGDMKDLVLTNRLWSALDRVAIYGWHRPDGRPIQPLSTVHGWRYVDYSHGVRLVSTHVWVNGELRDLFDVLQDPQLAGALSSDGTLRQPTALIDDLSARPLEAADPFGRPDLGPAVSAAVRAPSIPTQTSVTATAQRSCSSESRGDSWRGCLGP